MVDEKDDNTFGRSLKIRASVSGNHTSDLNIAMKFFFVMVLIILCTVKYFYRNSEHGMSKTDMENDDHISHYHHSIKESERRISTIFQTINVQKKHLYDYTKLLRP